MEIRGWNTGGPDCNLDGLGKIGIEELNWDMQNSQLLDPIMTEGAESLLPDAGMIKKGEYEYYFLYF